MYGEPGAQPFKRRRTEDAAFNMVEEPVLSVPALDVVNKHEEILHYSDRQLDDALGDRPFSAFSEPEAEEAMMENSFENVGVDFKVLEERSVNDSSPGEQPGTSTDIPEYARWPEITNVDENFDQIANGDGTVRANLDYDNDDSGLSFSEHFRDQIPGASAAITVKITWNTRVRGADGELLTNWHSTEWQSTEWPRWIAEKKLPPVPEPHLLYAEVKQGAQKLFEKEIDPYHELTDHECARIRKPCNSKALKKIETLLKDWENTNSPEISTKIWLRIFSIAVITWNERVRDDDGILRTEWLCTEWQCEQWRELIDDWTKSYGVVPPVPPPDVLYQKASTGAARKFGNEIDLYAELTAEHCATVRLGMKSQKYTELLKAYKNAKKNLDARAKDFWQYVHSRVVNKSQSQTTRKNQRDGLDNHFRAVGDNHKMLEKFLDDYSGDFVLPPGRWKEFEDRKRELLGKSRQQADFAATSLKRKNSKCEPTGE